MSVSREIGAMLLAFPPLAWSQAGQTLARPPPASPPRLIPIPITTTWSVPGALGARKKEEKKKPLPVTEYKLRTFTQTYKRGPGARSSLAKHHGPAVGDANRHIRGSTRRAHLE
ncbi:uncharacterized protein LY79DRAFT_80819 [Colletotrichum navitas]|uniref:Uncharacterized protein n=1 Tax=Colletotrichum navitas TaxID=681940 RepID=A0AAD8Q5B2_9PEZI|nr:uncharacterized protein LY79DRAFT_80819 [Colletotrichum navitas]KAK1596137.1 hypothetical protein LY79DRAFT_80819 [Colletotrichum navitas]